MLGRLRAATARSPTRRGTDPQLLARTRPTAARAARRRRRRRPTTTTPSDDDHDHADRRRPRRRRRPARRHDASCSPQAADRARRRRRGRWHRRTTLGDVPGARRPGARRSSTAATAGWPTARPRPPRRRPRPPRAAADPAGRPGLFGPSGDCYYLRSVNSRRGGPLPRAARGRRRGRGGEAMAVSGHRSGQVQARLARHRAVRLQAQEGPERGRRPRDLVDASPSPSG